MRILLVAYFAVQSTYHIIKDKIPGYLVFDQDMIIPIKHIGDCRYIRQRKQVKIKKGVIRENSTRIHYDYRVGDQVLLINKSAYKYETPFQGMREGDGLRGGISVTG